MNLQIKIVEMIDGEIKARTIIDCGDTDTYDVRRRAYDIYRQCFGRDGFRAMLEYDYLTVGCVPINFYNDTWPTPDRHIVMVGVFSNGRAAQGPAYTTYLASSGRSLPDVFSNEVMYLDGQPPVLAGAP
jgi:hypothetical protein